MITGYFVQWELWNVTWTRPRLLERTGLDCSFLTREIRILQKDPLHSRLIAFTIKTAYRKLTTEICHSLKSKPTNWKLCLSHGHASIAYQLKKLSRLQFGPIRPPLPRFYLRDMPFGSSSGSPKSGGGRGGGGGCVRMIWPLMDASPVRTAILYLEPDH